MIIEVTGDGHGAFNFVAKAKADTWPPMYMAYGRTQGQIQSLAASVIDEFVHADQEFVVDVRSDPGT